MQSALHDACSWRLSSGLQSGALRHARRTPSAVTGMGRAVSSVSARAEAGAAGVGGERYAARGVSASKEDVHNAIKNIDKGLFPKAFCKARTRGRLTSANWRYSRI